MIKRFLARICFSTFFVFCSQSACMQQEAPAAITPQYRKLQKQILRLENLSTKEREISREKIAWYITQSYFSTEAKLSQDFKNTYIYTPQHLFAFLKDLIDILDSHPTFPHFFLFVVLAHIQKWTEEQPSENFYDPTTFIICWTICQKYELDESLFSKDVINLITARPPHNLHFYDYDAIMQSCTLFTEQEVRLLAKTYFDFTFSKTHLNNLFKCVDREYNTTFPQIRITESLAPASSSTPLPLPLQKIPRSIEHEQLTK